LEWFNIRGIENYLQLSPLAGFFFLKFETKIYFPVFISPGKSRSLQAEKIQALFMIKKTLKYLLFIFIFLHIIAGVIGCKLLFMDAPEYFERAALNKPYDAIIVPGVPFENGAWSGVLKSRILWSYYLYKNGYAKNIIYSGSSVYTPYVESKIMAMYAEQLGIPKEHIFSETKAEHSTENVYYGYKLGLNQGFKKMALATDPFQTKTLMSFIEKLKIDLPVIPMVYDKMDSLIDHDPVIDSQQAFVNPFIPLPDREGFWQRLRGTMGKRIKYDSRDL
jgi:uncharacterized SAM-binding protein YcdF (DUF218 family)